MAQTLHNNVFTKLAASLSNSATSISLLDGSDFPTPAVGDFYFATLVSISGSTGKEDDWEIVKVTGKPATNTLTVTRGQEGTAARAWDTYTPCEIRITAGTVIMPDGNQNLSNKTITSSTLDDTVVGGTTAAAGSFTDLDATTVEATNVEVTNIKAKDGTAAGSIADSTGVVTLDSAVLATADINGGTVDGATIGQNTAALGTFTDMVADELQLTGGSGDQGTLSWNADEDTVALVVSSGESLQLGQEVEYNVRNNSGSSIAKGVPVMITGTLGSSGRITIDEMDATSIANDKKYLGITAEAIASGSDGKVMYFGKVSGLNTSSYSDGDLLFLDTSVVGGLTATEPNSGIKLGAAYVVHSHASAGVLMVRPSASVGLHDLHDVFVDAPGTGEIIRYNAVSGVWETKTLAEAGIAPINNASLTGDLTVDTDTLFVDASTDRVGVNIIPNRSFEINSGDTVGQRWSNTSANNFVEMGTTAGSIRFGTQSGDFLLLTGGDSVYAGESTALIVDSDGNVGIGTDDPVYFQNGPVLNIGSTSDTYTQLNLTSSSSGICYLAFGDSTTGTGRYQGLQWFDHSLNTMNWSTDGQSATPRMTINSSGNVGIGIDAPTEKLTVRGDVTLTPDSTSAADRLAALTIGKRDSGTTGYMGKIDFVGSGTNGFATDIVFSSKTSDFYNSTTIEHMRITASGFVGLGTDDPTAPLSIRKGDSSTTIGGSGSVIKVRNTSGVLNSTSGLELFHGNSETAVQRLCGIYGQYKTYDASGLGGDLVFATQTAGASSVTERMRIDEDGNVGIGNDSPAYPLQIGDGTDTYETLAITSADSNGRSQIFMGDSNVDALRMVYWNDSDKLTFGHDANIEFTLDSSGNVDLTNSLGVGQEAGVLRLMATGQSGFTVVGRLTSVSTASFLEFKDNGTTADYKVRVGSEGDDMHLYAGGYPRIVVKDDGKVKIGQSSADPDTALEVYGVQSTAGTRTAPFDVLKITANYAGGDGQPYGSSPTVTGWGGGIVFENESYNGSFYNSAAIYSHINDNSTATHGGDLSFYTSATRGGSLISRMRLTYEGNVGIGTQSPASLVSGGDSPVLSIGGTDSALTTGDKSGAVSFITNDPSFTNTYSDGITSEIASVAESGVGGAYGLHFYTGTTGSGGRGLRFRIDNNGNVGIGAPAVSGVSAPLDVDKATPFNNCVANFGEFVALSGYQRGVVNINGRVNGSDYPASLSMVVRNSGNSNWLHGRIVYNNNNEFIIEKNGAGSGAPVEQMKINNAGRHDYTHNTYAYGAANYFIKGVSSGGNVYIGNINGSLYLASNAYYYGGSLRQLDAGETASAAVYLGSDGSINFQQVIGATAGSNATASTISKFDANGNLLVGKSSGASSIRVNFMGASSTSSNTVLLLEDSSGTDLFEVRCDGRIRTGSASASPYNQTVSFSANLWINSSGVLYRTTSSARYKENIQDMTFGLSDVLALRPVTFEQKNENTGRKFGGFIAEEVHEAGLVDFVEYNDDDEPDAIGYGNMVSLLTKAIQEQQAMIETLQAEVAALKGAN